MTFKLILVSGALSQSNWSFLGFNQSQNDREAPVSKPTEVNFIISSFWNFMMNIQMKNKIEMTIKFFNHHQMELTLGQNQAVRASQQHRLLVHQHQNQNERRWLQLTISKSMKEWVVTKILCHQHRCAILVQIVRVISEFRHK